MVRGISMERRLLQPSRERATGWCGEWVDYDIFGGALSVNGMSLATSSIAALWTSGGSVSPGLADVPFAVSSDCFTGVANCDGDIQFSPTGPNGYARLHVFD